MNAQNKEGNSFVRFAIALGSSSASTFPTTLLKVICYTLISSETPLSCSEISEKISKDFLLDFSNKEILDAIKKSKGTIIIASKDSSANRYVLSPAAISKYSSQKEDPLGEVIDEFLPHLQEKEKINLRREEAQKVIADFFYNLFDTNKEKILSVLRKECVNIKDIYSDADERKTQIINSFLTWDNEKKDHLVYSMSNAAFSYCTLTLKKALPIEKILSSKRFFLDTNVIFSIAGINGPEKEKSMRLFLKKCQSNGMSLYYTNITKDECMKTLFGLVRELKETIGGAEIPDIGVIKNVFPDSHPDDFYEYYAKWAKDYKSAGDFDGFHDFLLEQINSVFASLQIALVPVAFSSQNQDFKDLSESLSAYKTTEERRPSEQSVESDIENYLFIKETYNETAQSISDINDFFVTFDRKLCEWIKNKVLVGLVVPYTSVDVLYTLLLHFSQRAEDDYRAFNEFFLLSIREEYIDKTESDERRIVLAKIMQLSEEKQVKERALVVAQKIYQDDKALGVAFDAGEIADKAIKAVIPEYQNLARNETKEEYEGKIDGIRKEANITAEKAKIDGINEGKMATYRVLATKRAKTNKTIKITLYIFFAAVVITTIALFIYGKVSNIDYLKPFTTLIWAACGISALFEIIFALLDKAIASTHFLSTDVGYLEKKIKDKMEKTIP